MSFRRNVLRRNGFRRNVMDPTKTCLNHYKVHVSFCPFKLAPTHNAPSLENLSSGFVTRVDCVSKSTGIAKFTGNSVGFRLTASRVIQIYKSIISLWPQYKRNNCKNERAYFTEMTHLIPLTNPIIMFRYGIIFSSFLNQPMLPFLLGDLLVSEK